jgi:hypothetical protein
MLQVNIIAAIRFAIPVIINWHVKSIGYFKPKPFAKLEQDSDPQGSIGFELSIGDCTVVHHIIRF